MARRECELSWGKHRRIWNKSFSRCWEPVPSTRNKSFREYRTRSRHDKWKLPFFIHFFSSLYKLLSDFMIFLHFSTKHTKSIIWKFSSVFPRLVCIPDTWPKFFISHAEHWHFNCIGSDLQRKSPNIKNVKNVVNFFSIVNRSMLPWVSAQHRRRRRRTWTRRKFVRNWSSNTKRRHSSNIR